VDSRLRHPARLLPPPAQAPPTPDWGRSRAETGFTFPSDYRSFVNLYGAGWVGATSWYSMEIYAPSLAPRHPGATTGFEGFVDWHVSTIAHLFAGMNEDEWGGTVHPLFPAPGGLLTWGENREGDVFWWLTEGDDPDRWPIVMWARGPATTYRFETGMVELLHAMVRGEPWAPCPGWMHSPMTRWTRTSDWLGRGLEISAGPPTPGTPSDQAGQIIRERETKETDPHA